MIFKVPSNPNHSMVLLFQSCLSKLRVMFWSSVCCVLLQSLRFSVNTSLWVRVSLARLQEPLWKVHEMVSFSLCRTETCEVLCLSTDTHPFLFSPVCQCNGHSKCVNESICEKCENLTTGKHCETCISGYYGDPTNGGTCQRKWCLKSSCAEVFWCVSLFTRSSAILTEIVSQ